MVSRPTQTIFILQCNKFLNDFIWLLITYVFHLITEMHGNTCCDFLLFTYVPGWIHKDSSITECGIQMKYVNIFLKLYAMGISTEYVLFLKI